MLINLKRRKSTRLYLWPGIFWLLCSAYPSGLVAHRCPVLPLAYTPTQSILNRAAFFLSATWLIYVIYSYLSKNSRQVTQPNKTKKEEAGVQEGQVEGSEKSPPKVTEGGLKERLKTPPPPPNKFLKYGGQFLLMAAVHNNTEQVKKYIEEQGVDVNYKNSAGHTAINLAAYNCNKDMVDLLADLGAEVHLLAAPSIYDGPKIPHDLIYYTEKMDGYFSYGEKAKSYRGRSLNIEAFNTLFGKLEADFFKDVGASVQYIMNQNGRNERFMLMLARWTV